MNNDNRKGFGSNISRFDKSGNENPGPGNYEWEDIDLRSHISTNIKGNTNLISKSKNFYDKTDIIISPGPGQYKTDNFNLKSKSDKNFVMLPGRERPIFSDEQFNKIKNNLDNPEPGQYDKDKYHNYIIDEKTKKENYIFLRKEEERSHLNVNSITTPHCHYYNKNNDKSIFLLNTDKDKYIKSNHMFSQSVEKRVPINLYDPTKPIDNTSDPGPGFYFHNQTTKNNDKSN